VREVLAAGNNLAHSRSQAAATERVRYDADLVIAVDLLEPL
jgi:hypothetical protein